MTNTEIIQTDGTSLDVYRGRDEVRELADRLLSLHPQASEVGAHGMRAVAQLAILIDASPLPGTNEIHVWKDKEGKIKFQLGINYYRRKAIERGGLLWSIPPREMRDDERKQYGISDGQLAAICHGVRARDMEKYIGMGFTPNQIWDMVGATGMAIAGTGYKEQKNGRPAIWTAFKRAEVDIYRCLFPTMMQEIAEAQAGDIQIIDEPAPDELDEPDDEIEYTVDEINDRLFGPELDPGIDPKKVGEESSSENGEPETSEPWTDEIAESQDEAEQVKEQVIEALDAEPEPPNGNGHDMTLPDDDFINAKLEELPKQNATAYTIASWIASWLAYYGHANHALNATSYDRKDRLDESQQIEMVVGLIDRVKAKAEEVQ
jgi:hypothetical protein